MFDPATIQEIVEVAKRNSIDPAALMAVAECEADNGQAFEPADKKTPLLLFERHIFYRELKSLQPQKLQTAVNAGLATPKWNKSVQYKDEGTSSRRLALLARARAVDEECAIRSCSWGVGQTMGFLAEELGFGSANEMLAFMVAGGLAAQVECMVREIKNKKLISKLNAHNWAGFARVYNGAGYAANHYDTRMAAAYAKWHNKLADDSDAADVAGADEPIDMPRTRIAEPVPMTQSKTGNTSIAVATGTAVTTAAGIVKSVSTDDTTPPVERVTEVLDQVGNVVVSSKQVIEHVPDHSMIHKLVVFLTDPIVLGVVLVGVLAGCGFIWWDRRRLKQESQV